jgi:amino acid permease
MLAFLIVSYFIRKIFKKKSVHRNSENSLSKKLRKNENNGKLNSNKRRRERDWRKRSSRRKQLNCRLNIRKKN